MAKTITELRDEIVQLNILPKDVAYEMGKIELRETLENYHGSKCDDELELEIEEETYETSEEDLDGLPPEQDSLGWEPFIMEQFHGTELEDGFPKINGLRRLTKKFIGNIVESGPIKVESYDTIDGPKAVVIYEVKIEPHILTGEVCFTETDARNGTIPIKCITFRGLANACSANVSGDIFASHMEPIAETRAEARALRKILGINIVGVDEKGKSVSEKGGEFLSGSEITINGDSPCMPAQKMLITARCEGLGIDVEKFINRSYYTGKSKEKTYEDIDGVTREHATAMVKELNRYQSTTEASIDIPEEIKDPDKN